MLLGALCSRGELLADEAVRSLILSAADDVARRLAPGGAVGPEAAAGLALAFARAVQHGLLAGRGPGLVDQLLQVAAAGVGGSGGGGAALPPRAAREVLAALEAASVEGPEGLRAAAEAALGAEGAAARGAAGRGGGEGGGLMEAWESV
ncbi:hypothetical protein MNEG_11993 [Monoraphidium neglectum]|uniref:Uncharacterized protein n=1 Tax=Monoraphidium neglectum TaxID=145388 RepID=A0A0D2MMD9_9CHLO|nr:hypothetical protein MNEG_11993 [Monoraphidium neglectum]KIY95970.1 hypothetical protein MNEG_11993 [Monoraphidium neglectum]|eukprot:XP_013894990.1 hypothetical protein MNEG_11993 [Monoraphidium neglectum]